MARSSAGWLVLVGITMAAATLAQQPQQGARPGISVPPLGDGPFVFDTGEQHKIRVVVVTKGLSHPWSLAFLPNGNMLITERAGRLRIVRDGVLYPNPVAGVPVVRAQGLAGLMDLAFHPRVSEITLICVVYHKPTGDPPP